MRIQLTKGVIRLLFTALFGLVFTLFLISYAYIENKASLINRFDDDHYIITDLEIRTCSVFKGGCSGKDDWFKIPKKLNYNAKGKPLSKLTSQYLFVKKRPVRELKKGEKVLTNFGSNDGKWSYDFDSYDSTRPGDFYYNVDVLFGEDAVDPRPEWQFHKSALRQVNSEIPFFLTFKTQAVNSPLPKIDLRVSKDDYKILQVADLHFSSFEGICRDQYPEIENCKADMRTLNFVNKVLDIEKPDLVVLTGDQIFGDDSFDSVTTTLKVLSPFIERKIPYALMFGNHDDEGSLSREELMKLTTSLPYNIAHSGPEDVDGVGNYVFQVKEKGTEKAALSMYVLDSHKYSTRPKIQPGYDWLKENQLEFVKTQHETLKPTEGSKHLSFAFFHIPLPEYKNVQQGFVGNYKEAVMSPRYNTGARDVLQEIGVSVISVGHDHCNDYCLLDAKSDDNDDNKIWLCYGGGSGEGGYGGYGGTTRRLRIFKVDTKNGKIESYKRLETSPDETFDHQVLV